MPHVARVVIVDLLDHVTPLERLVLRLQAESIDPAPLATIVIIVLTLENY